MTSEDVMWIVLVLFVLLTFLGVVLALHEIRQLQVLLESSK